MAGAFIGACCCGGGGGGCAVWLCAIGGPGLLFLLLLRRMKTSPRIRIAITAIPPTAPPTMAPIGVGDLGAGAAEAVEFVGEAVDVVEDTRFADAEVGVSSSSLEALERLVLVELVEPRSSEFRL